VLAPEHKKAKSAGKKFFARIAEQPSQPDTGALRANARVAVLIPLASFVRACASTKQGLSILEESMGPCQSRDPNATRVVVD